MGAGQWVRIRARQDRRPELPVDQRHDDAGSSVFDTEPLSEAMHLIGRPSIDPASGLRPSSWRKWPCACATCTPTARPNV